MAAETELREALDRHLANMAGAPVIDWDNVGFDQDQQTYLTQSILPAESITVGAGVGGTDVLAGIYQIIISVPKNTGKNIHITEYERIKAHFVRSMSLVEDGTRVTIIKVWAAPAITGETHYRVPVSIRYRAI